MSFFHLVKRVLNEILYLELVHKETKGYLLIITIRHEKLLTICTKTKRANCTIFIYSVSRLSRDVDVGYMQARGKEMQERNEDPAPRSFLHNKNRRCSSIGSHSSTGCSTGAADHEGTDFLP